MAKLDEIQEEGCNTWVGYIDGERVAEFSFSDVDDDGRMWLVHAEVTRQREGLGSEMMAFAVREYGKVWASSAGRDEDYGSETRYLTEAGAALVNSCIRQGIMKAEWLTHPFDSPESDPPDEDEGW